MFTPFIFILVLLIPHATVQGISVTTPSTTEPGSIFSIEWTGASIVISIKSPFLHFKNQNDI